MPSFSPDYTSRYRAHYHACGIDHTIQLRKQLGATPGQTALLAGTVHDIFAAAAADLPNDFAFLSAEQADEGSDLFYPAPTPVAVVGIRGVVSYTPFQKVTHTRFACRAVGSRSSIEMYGIWWEYSNKIDDVDTVAYDGVATPTERAYIGTIAGLLNTQAFANSGDPSSVWAARATIKVNDFWLRQVRSGGIT